MLLNYMYRSRAFYSFAGVILLAVTIFGMLPVVAQEDPGVQEVEIRFYQGEKLGSVENFRENSIRGVQRIDVADYELTIDGLVMNELAFSYEELQTMSHIQKLVTLNCVEGWSVKALWEGIPLISLFEMAGPTDEVNTVVFYAEDGYTTSLSLAFITAHNLIIADRINEIILPAENGFPFQLVAEDKWGYKWIKWITRIELSDDPSYKGFWEIRGYNNNGDLAGSKYE